VEADGAGGGGGVSKDLNLSPMLQKISWEKKGSASNVWKWPSNYFIICRKTSSKEGLSYLRKGQGIQGKEGAKEDS